MGHVYVATQKLGFGCVRRQDTQDHSLKREQEEFIVLSDVSRVFGLSVCWSQEPLSKNRNTQEVHETKTPGSVKPLQNTQFVK